MYQRCHERTQVALWGDHIASWQQKVEKRIGLLKRISHLIPRAQRLTLVNTMIIPLFDYGDLFGG